MNSNDEHAVARDKPKDSLPTANPDPGEQRTAKGPMEGKSKQLSNDHIPTVEIEQDIADTEHEIAVMKREVTAFEAVPRESKDFRMSRFRADARIDGIRQREDFITKLRAILMQRSEQAKPKSESSMTPVTSDQTTGTLQGNLDNPETKERNTVPELMGCICVLRGGSMHTISVGGKLYEFEMHPYCGPTLLDKHGGPLEHQPMPFLEAASLWAQQGQKEENGLCVWYHEAKPILKHLGGRHYQVMGHHPAERGE